MITMRKFKGPRAFVQVGDYQGRNKRKNSVFRVVNGVTAEDLADAVEKAVNSLTPLASAE
jgi:hypothetical protein